MSFNQNNQGICIKASQYWNRQKSTRGGEIEIYPTVTNSGHELILQLHGNYGKVCKVWLSEPRAVELADAIKFIVSRQPPDRNGDVKSKHYEYLVLHLDVGADMYSLMAGRDQVRAKMLEAIDKELDTIYPFKEFPHVDKETVPGSAEAHPEVGEF